MATWRFYQGVRGEWRWYRMANVGDISQSSDQAFAELEACMANAAYAGFDHQNFQVHARERRTVPRHLTAGSEIDTAEPHDHC
jgi:hypothetical protein